MLCGEKHLHSGGAGCCDAASDGTEPITHTTDEDGHSVAGHVSQIDRFRDEYPSEINCQTGSVNFDHPLVSSITEVRKMICWLLGELSLRTLL